MSNSFHIIISSPTYTYTFRRWCMGIGMAIGLVLTCSNAIFAQLEFKKYWIQFSDKNGTPYSLSSPENFLSEKALARRSQYGIALQNNDLPVNPNYIATVRDMGATVLYPSKWFNGVVVQVNDSATLLAIQELPFVQQTKAVAKKAGRIGGGNHPATNMPASFKTSGLSDETDDDSLYYGTAKHQIEMMNGHLLHQNGLKGAGMTVAILDAGFSKVDVNPVFAQHFANGQILGTRDFVDFDGYVYDHSSHGANVFAIMGGNQPDFYVGAAPEADYWLIRTEEGSTETSIEEYNWVAGAEFADSVGVDVINSSLGYSIFDYSYMNYNYEDMDGQVAIVTRGADIAASKGILVVTSAGNQGNKAWQHITAPADADSVLTVGAVDSLAAYATFSSRGPSSDGRIKPNVVGQGHRTAYVNTAGALEKGSGTSYSSPLVAGLATCLWQYDRTLNNMDIIHNIQQSADRYLNPNDSVGYGLPNFGLAMQYLSTNLVEQFGKNAFVYPNPSSNNLTLYYYADQSEIISYGLFSLSGQLLFEHNAQVIANLPYQLDVKGWTDLPEGIYLLQLRSHSQNKTLKAVKVR
ncbi:MAG: S8 family serine peptidase [Chitinophagales bacterium]|nr:S8 family serine peptidase [Chitinophagales bacterium]